jgi:hypothetical protein
LAALEGRTAAPDKTPAPASAPTPPSPQEIAQHNAAAQAALVARLEREGSDPHWSPGATASFKSDLGKTQAIQTGAVVKDVTCGTTMCAAQIAWNDYASAKKDYKSLLTEKYDLNCKRTVYVPPPDDPSAAYSATLFLDCESFRADGR